MHEMVWVTQRETIAGSDPEIYAYIPPGQWTLEKMSYHIESATYILGRLTLSHVRMGQEMHFVSGHPMFDYGDTYASSPQTTVEGGQAIKAVLQNASCGTGAYHTLTLWLRRHEHG